MFNNKRNIYQLFLQVDSTTVCNCVNIVIFSQEYSLCNTLIEADSKQVETVFECEGPGTGWLALIV